MVYCEDMKLDRISLDPRVCLGKACVRGMRITVSLVVNLVANGLTSAEIREQHPDLEEEDIRQCLRYAAWLTEEREMLCEAPEHAASR